MKQFLIAVRIFIWQHQSLIFGDRHHKNWCGLSTIKYGTGHESLIVSGSKDHKTNTVKHLYHKTQTNKMTSDKTQGNLM